MSDEGLAAWHRSLSAIREGWLLIVVLAVTVAAATAVTGALEATTERVTGRFVVGTDPGLDADFGMADSLRVLTQAGVLGTLAEVIENPSTIEAAVAEVEGATPGVYEVTAEQIGGSTVVEVHVDGPSGAANEAVATEIMSGSAALFSELYPIFVAELLDPPRPVGDTVGVPNAQLVALGTLVGAAAGVLLLLAWASLRERVSRFGGIFRRRPGRVEPTSPTDSGAAPTEPEKRKAGVSGSS